MDNFGWNRVVIIQQEENLFALVTLIARKICNNTVKNCTLMPVMNVTLRLSKIGCIAEKFGGNYTQQKTPKLLCKNTGGNLNTSQLAKKVLYIIHICSLLSKHV